MRIQKLAVRNFRCVKDGMLDCDSLTVLVGRNGAGKSTFLQALDVFYNANADFAETDFYNKNVEQSINIMVTYCDLTDQEKNLFMSYMNGEQLTVDKEISWSDGKPSQKFYGSILGCTAFMPIRNAGTVTEKRELYAALRQQAGFEDLTAIARNASNAVLMESLQAWEANHQDSLERIRDDGQFFGFKEVGGAKLRSLTRFVFVPAVRDANQDATEGKGRAVTALMDIVVRRTLGDKAEIQQLRQDTQARYKEIVGPEDGLDELNTLEQNLSDQLQVFAPGTGLSIAWDTDKEIDIPMPTAEVYLEEDGYRSPVDHVGHGLQRSYIFTMLQELSLIQAREVQSTISQNSKEGTDGGEPIIFEPNLILAIEEAELYQHPSRQRHLSKILRDLTKGTGNEIPKTQVIYTTHSPLFVDIERFDQVRRLYKAEEEEGKPKVTRVCKASFSEYLAAKEDLDGVERDSYSAAGERARLKTLMTPWTNEGFFADMIVFVEGEEDRAAILGMVKLRNIDIESKNITMIPCNGKTNLPKAILIFGNLKIPMYTIWDSDRDKGVNGHPETNCSLLTLNGHEPQDFPGTMIRETCACFEYQLTKTIPAGIGGDLYREIMDELKEQYGFKKDDHARKNPDIVKALLEEAARRGKTCDDLDGIVQSICTLGGITT
ncbi:MAG: ATP-dependent nuclease [Armatimonadota bacterium]